MYLQVSQRNLFQTVVFYAGMLFAVICLGGSPALADGAPEALAGLDACANRSGKDLHNCVADVLERFAAQNGAVPQTQSEILRAASGLRAATSRAQAVRAITQCYNVINAALKQTIANGTRIPGVGSTRSLTLFISVISKAVRLIQAKG